MIARLMIRATQCQHMPPRKWEVTGAREIFMIFAKSRPQKAYSHPTIMNRRDVLKYLAAAFASGCGRYAPGENALEIANLQPPAAQVPINQLMWRAVARFRETHPEVQVEPASGGGGGYQELMIRVMEGHPPDIMSFATAETGLTYAYVEQGHVLDITEYLQRPAWDTPGKTWLETIDPLYREPLMHQGRFYAIPKT